MPAPVECDTDSDSSCEGGGGEGEWNTDQKITEDITEKIKNIDAMISELKKEKKTLLKAKTCSSFKKKKEAKASKAELLKRIKSGAMVDAREATEIGLGAFNVYSVFSCYDDGIWCSDRSVTSLYVRDGAKNTILHKVGDWDTKLKNSPFGYRPFPNPYPSQSTKFYVTDAVLANRA